VEAEWPRRPCYAIKRPMARLPQLLAATLASACGPAPAGPEPGTGTSAPTSTSDSPTTDLPPTTTSEAGTESSTTGGSSSFMVAPDLADGADLTCNPWAQNCPKGEKCAPWVPSGRGPFTDAKCVQIIGNQAPGETCTAPEGIDDCASGSFCWEVDDDNHGVCFLQCTGNPDTPICPPKTGCRSDQYSVLALCFSDCDPLLQDCPKDNLCVQNVDSFVCIPDASGDEGQVNDACEFVGACDPGLVCFASVMASGNCDPQSSGCCQPFCSLPDGPCPNPDQQCLPLEQTPSGFEHVGICAVPK